MPYTSPLQVEQKKFERCQKHSGMLPQLFIQEAIFTAISRANTLPPGLC